VVFLVWFGFGLVLLGLRSDLSYLLRSMCSLLIVNQVLLRPLGCAGRLGCLRGAAGFWRGRVRVVLCGLGDAASVCV